MRSGKYGGPSVAKSLGLFRNGIGISADIVSRGYMPYCIDTAEVGKLGGSDAKGIRDGGGVC